MYLVTDLNELMTIHYAGVPAERKDFASEKGPCKSGALLMNCGEKPISRISGS